MNDEKEEKRIINLEKSRKYYQKNRDRILSYRRKYVLDLDENTKEYYKEYHRQYRIKNLERIKEYQKKYWENRNLEKKNKKRN